MQNRPPHHHMHRNRQILHNATAWALARRRAALALALRGACYGAGTGTVGLLTMWLQHRL